VQYGVENCSSKLWIKVKEKLLNILEQLKQSLDAPNGKCFVGQLWVLKLHGMYDSSGVPLMGLRDPCVHWVLFKVLWCFFSSFYNLLLTWFHLYSHLFGLPTKWRSSNNIFCTQRVNWTNLCVRISKQFLHTETKLDEKIKAQRPIMQSCR
jgi:hypothetical protein